MFLCQDSRVTCSLAMARAAVFVLSSTYEGLGNVPIEGAWPVWCPVVSTDCPSGPAEILENGQYGRLVPVGDPVAMAQAITSTLDALPIEDCCRSGPRSFRSIAPWSNISRCCLCATERPHLEAHSSPPLEPVRHCLRDEAKEVRPDARPQARKNRRRIHWNTLRIFSGRERRRWLRIVRRNRTVNVGQAPRRQFLLYAFRVKKLLLCPASSGQ